MEHTRFEKIVNDKNKFYAHTRTNNEILNREKLQDHLEEAFRYFLEIVKYKNIDLVLENIFKELINNMEYYDLYLNMIADIIYFHDIGKINPKFQNMNMKNSVNIEGWTYGSEHSKYSSILYVYHYSHKINDIKNESVRNVLLKLMFLNAYVISKHHGNLLDMEKANIKFIDYFSGKLFEKDIKVLLNLGILSDDFTNNKELKIEHVINSSFELIEQGEFDIFDKNYYIYSRLIFSLLLASDYYSTTNYMTGFETVFENIDYEGFKEQYYESSLLKQIRKKIQLNNIDEKNMNDVRTEIFNDIENEFFKNKDKNIYFLESPTGSGKSNVALNLSFRMFDERINKLIYAYPFNTLIEQNKNTLGNYYIDTEYEKYINVINSITKIKCEEDNDFSWKDFTKSVMDRQFLHNPIIVTSNVFLFDIFFGNNKSDLFSLYQLCNSVIVLDEIQAYDYSLWQEIIEMLDCYSKLLNIKFIIMSATLPDLSIFLDENSKLKVSKLTKDTKSLFEKDVFKKRVHINYDLLEYENFSYESLLAHIVKNSMHKNKILIEFISKKNADEFYKYCKENLLSDHEILILTRDDNLYTRNNIVERLSKDNKIILIATQVVEAGLDIDMDIGYKNISMLENEEQFLGRINRSCKKENCVAYFFNIFDARKIYKENYNKDFSLLNSDRKEELKSKDFKKYYTLKLNVLKSKNKSKITGYGKFKDDLKSINFKSISNSMKLIKNDYLTYKIFFNRDISIENKLLNGEKVWEKYKELLNSDELEYNEKYYKLFNHKVDMSYFIYEIPVRKIEIQYFDDQIGDLIYIKNSDIYFDENGRLNLEQEFSGGLII